MQCLLYLAFGMPIGMLGASWPEARHLFDRSAGSLGVVAAAYGMGRLVTAPSALPILRRWAIGPSTAAIAGALAAAGVATALTRSFPVLVVTFALIGLSSGALDSLGNRYQTVVRDVGSAGLMFGSYGVGATFGPILIAVVGWSPAFVVAALLAAGGAALAGQAAVAWPEGLGRDAPAPTDHVERAPAPTGVVVLSLSLFAIYCSLEVTTGTWGATYLEGDHGTSGSVAAWATSGFWAGLTFGRLFMGRLAGAGRRLDPHHLLLGSGIGATVVYLLLPVAPAPLAVALITAAGVALAAMFPTLMATTADRVGVAATGKVMAWQLLSANVAELAMSAAVGVLVNRVGIGSVATVLAALSLLGLPLLLWSNSLHAADRRAPAPAATPST